MRPLPRLTAVLLSAAFALVICGCGKKSTQDVLKPAAQPPPPNPEHVVAVVNDTPLTWADMEKRAMGFLKDDIETNHLIVPTNRMEEAKEHFRRRSISAFVFKTVMMDEAAKNKITLTPADRQDGLKNLAIALKTRNWTTNDYFLKGPMGEATMRSEFEDGLLIDKLLKTQVRSKLKIGNQEIADMIALIDATNDLKRVTLEGVRKQLAEGADFGDVARNLSECASAKNGGDLGELARGKMPKAFDDAAFAQEIGTISPVVATPYGYHLIKVNAHTPAKEATASTPAVPETIRASHILLKQIPVDRKQITDSILRAKFKAGVDTYYRELKANAKIECYLYKDMKF